MAARTDRYAALAARLAAGALVVIDGAIGTELNRRGLSLDAWTATASVDAPDLVAAMHDDYLDAGADVVSANTFGCSGPRLADYGIGDRMAELNRAAVALARDARDRARSDAIVAGCVTTVAFRGRDGSRDAAPEEEGALAEQAGVLAEAGVDILIVEMLANVEHANVQLAAVVGAGLPVWAGFSCVANADTGALRLLGEPDEPLEASLRRIDLVGVDVALVMHTRLDVTGAALASLRRVWPGPSGAYPHGGRWMRPGWSFDPDFSPEALAAGAAEWLADGAQLVGGCCGSTPDHVRALRRLVDNRGASP